MGTLSAAQIAEGINLAMINAARLIEDAEILFERKRFPSAAALAILAIEEGGKGSILRGLAIIQDDDALRKRSWRDYRKHTKKNVGWLAPYLFRSKQARGLDDLAPLHQKDAPHVFILDQVKQLSLYTDCLGNANWSSPAEALGEDLARELLGTARTLVLPEEVTTEEIELWVKHLGPHLHVGPDAPIDYDTAKRAFLDWREDMKRRGLTDRGREEFMDFLYPERHD